MSCHQCPPHGQWYCERCADYAARAGLLLPREPTMKRLALHLDADAPEGDLQGKIQQLCKQVKALYWHALKSQGSTAGMPDCLIVAPEDNATNDGLTLHVWELKHESEQPSPAQKRWLAALAKVTRIDVATYYPKDWPIIVEKLLRK